MNLDEFDNQVMGMGEHRALEGLPAKARGLCPVCDRQMLVKADGTLRHHGGPVGSGMWDSYRSYKCLGVGKLPVSPPVGGQSEERKPQ